MEMTTEIFSQFDKKWALLTAGDAGRFNMMTISWGGMGTIWNKPVVTVYVRTSRYTHEFMDAGDYFTVSFYPERCRKTLAVLGAKSGREMDKMRASGLTAVPLAHGVTFREAERTLVCRKLFMQPLETERMPEDVQRALYHNNAPHDMYIGEVVEIL